MLQPTARRSGLPFPRCEAMTVKLDCLIGRVGETVKIPSPLLFSNQGIDAVFSAASNGEIALQLDTTNAPSPLLKTSTPSVSQLHTALRKMLKNTARPISKIGVLFTDRLDGD